MKTRIFIGLILITSTLVAQDNNPILTKQASNNPIDIQYETWKLSNGLKVLIHEDNSDPLVHVHVTYHVGSNRETAGKSGFAHFFEHMMFQGSENVPDEEHFKIINDAGGNMNGNTTSDRTVYFQTIPSNYLETALWLEADRMGFLLNAVTPEKFENQRDAVKNEKYQNQISRQYGMSYEILGQTLYPPSHPYNWPVIGYVDDLDRATLEDLKNFFLRWYGPNNAILTITGNVNSKEVLPLVQKYFGSIPEGVEVRKLGSMVPRLSSDIYTGYTDNVYLPLTDIVFPTVPNYHKDEAPLDMLAALMGGGKKSIFYKNFVKSEKALQASVSHPCRELSGEFHFRVLTFPDWQEDQGIYFNNVEADIRNTIAEWEETGFTDEDLEMVKTEMISQSVDMKTSISTKARMISQWEWLGRGKFNISSEIDRYKKVSRADIMRVFNKYIKNRKAVINTVRPKSPFVKELDSLISRNPNANLILDEDPQYDNLVYNRADNEFDVCCRSTQPKPAEPKTPNIPDYFKENFSNGLRTIFSQTNEIPKVYIRIKINGGTLLEDQKITGVANLTAQMMNESTQENSSESISVELQKLGSTISFSSEGDLTTIYIESLTENLNKTLDIAAEKLFKPGFNDEDFKRIKKSNIEGLESMKKNSGYLAQSAMGNILYGSTAYGRTMTEKIIKKIKLKDIKAYYDNNYSPNVSELVAVGNISQKDLYSKLNFLKEWKSKNVKLPQKFDFPDNKVTQIYLLDKEGATQSYILMGHRSSTYDVNGINYKSKIMNKSLGGGATGRLFSNLREDKGYTYGAYSFFRSEKNTGIFAIQTSVKTEVTDSALTEIFNILDNYTNKGLTNEEITSTKKSFLNSASLKYETPNQKLGFLNRILTYDLNKDYLSDQEKILNSITKDEINAIAKAEIKPDKMAIVIVGNKYLIKKKLENLKSVKDGIKYNFKINEIKY